MAKAYAVKVLEVSVKGNQGRLSVNRLRRDPDIIGRYWPALPTQLRRQQAVPFRGLTVDRGKKHPATLQELLQNSQIFGSLRPIFEAVE